MTKKLNEVLEKLVPQDLAYLADIGSLHVFWSPEDASRALNEGGVLLGVAKMDNDDDPFEGEEGFRVLIGVRRDANLTPWMAQYFQR